MIGSAAVATRPPTLEAPPRHRQALSRRVPPARSLTPELGIRAIAIVRLRVDDRGEPLPRHHAITLSAGDGADLSSWWRVAP